MEWIKGNHPNKTKFTGILNSKIALVRRCTGLTNPSIYGIDFWMGDKWCKGNSGGTKITDYMWIDETLKVETRKKRGEIGGHKMKTIKEFRLSKTELNKGRLRISIDKNDMSFSSPDGDASEFNLMIANLKEGQNIFIALKE